jgi:hypothetical protein
MPQGATNSGVNFEVCMLTLLSARVLTVASIPHHKHSKTNTLTKNTELKNAKNEKQHKNLQRFATKQAKSFYTRTEVGKVSH